MRRLGILIALLWLPTVVLAAGPTVAFYLFHSVDCEHCKVVKENVLPDLLARYPLEITELEVNDPANYRSLLALEGKLGRRTSDLPVIVIGRTILEGEEEAITKLEPAIVEALAAGGIALTPIPSPAAAPPAASPAQSARPFPLLLFLKPGCQLCSRAELDLKAIEREIPLAVTRISMAETQSKALLEAVERELGVVEENRLVPPTVVIGRTVLIGKGVTYEAMLAALRAGDPSATPVWETVDAGEGKRGILERFARLSPLTVVGAGLLDGVNPCAFATLIFFLSYLSVAGRKGRDLLIVGGAFTVAVFGTYLAVGLGAFSVINKLTFLASVARWVFGITFVFALVLGCLSLWDWNLARKGRLKDIALQLPEALKKRIHGVIRERARVKNMALAAFVTGFLVSILELACTGQVYLPTILFVVQQAELRAHAVGYLILYNLMFIFPLVIVFALAYTGVTSARFNEWMQRHAATVKLATAILFFALAGMMLGELI
jgi:cytochrome c biogenesis protein CcdA